MDDSQCVACHRGLTLEDIERGGFQHIGGKVYCAECVAKMRRVGPLVCPTCGTRDTPLYNGRTYECRKCGAAVDPNAQAPAHATPRTRGEPDERHAPRKRRLKNCPYCGGVLPAEALKCRYCGSGLTREAREFEVVAGQNHRLQFWLGCFLTATVILVGALVYSLTRRPRPAAVPAAARKAELQEQTIAELQRKLGKVTSALAGLQARRVNPPEAPRRPIPVPRPPRRPKPRTAAVVGTRTPAPRPPAKVSTKARVVKPSTGAAVAKPGSKAPPPRSPKPRTATPTAAQRAARAAYADFSKRFVRTRADRRYGDAIAACRQFISAHLGTLQATLVERQLRELRTDLQKVRDDHGRRFRKALDGNDLDAARQVIAQLSLYQAPELEQDVQRMTAEVKRAAASPERAVAAYLAQWQCPPHIARLLADLKVRRDGRWEPRQKAAQQLKLYKHSAALAGLIAARNDPEWFVACTAISALEEIGDPISLPYLVPLTRSSQPAIYDAAARACRHLAKAPRDTYAEAWKLVDAKKVAQELLEAIRHSGKEDSEVTTRYQIALIEALASLGVREIAPKLRAAVKPGNPAVQDALAAALRTLTGAKAPRKPTLVPPKPTPPAKPKPAPKPTTAARPAAPTKPSTTAKPAGPTPKPATAAKPKAPGAKPQAVPPKPGPAPKPPPGPASSPEKAGHKPETAAPAGRKPTPAPATTPAPKPATAPTPS